MCKHTRYGKPGNSPTVRLPTSLTQPQLRDARETLSLGFARAARLAMLVNDVM